VTKGLSGRRVAPGWWALGMFVLIAAIALLTAVAFSGGLVSSVPVTLTSERSGLVMETGSKVKLRGVEVGKVVAIRGGSQPVTLTLHLYPSAVKYIPANVQAEIRATTVFGAKYVDLIVPDRPSHKRIGAGAIVVSRNVTSEVNTVFQNLVVVLKQVDPPKLNAVLTAVAEGLRGKGQRIGEALSGGEEVLTALNARMDRLQQDFKSVGAVSETYAAAAPDIIKTLSAANTTGATITRQASELDEALVAAAGLSRSGIDLIAPNMQTFVDAFNQLKPTADMLLKYNPEYTCTLQGAYWLVNDAGGYEAAGGGNGRSTILDASFGWARDLYRYPTNLPIVAAKGGPDGKPGCGSLPRPDLNWPVRSLITNTGWGTGMDYRPNPGIAHPGLVDFFPVTRATPAPPFIFAQGAPPSIGPVTYPGAPPYGAPLYAPDGTPLWAGPPPGSPPPLVPGVPNPPPPYGTGHGPGG